MATFNPVAIEGHIYKNAKLCIKITSFNGITAHAVILDENKNPSSDEKDYTEFQWKQAKFKDITEEQSRNRHDVDSNNPPLGDGICDAQELPPITFAYDHEKKTLLVLNRRGMPVQEIPVMTIEGKNGISAFEVWKKWRNLGDETPISAFYEDIKGKDGNDAIEWTINSDGVWCRNGELTSYCAVGKDGKDGKSAYEQWAENQPAEMRTLEHWHNSLQGKNGTNGLSAFEEWKSLLPEERRNATLSDFFSWLVKQTEERIDAKEGATWVPNFVDGKIVFQNNRTKAVSDSYIVKGKDGRSFIPKIVDEKLTFVDDNGNEVTPRHDYRGKSAFELWQEQPENESKTLKDFFDFLKGEKGDQGLDGIVREARHSYLDIKDHVCPVQKIDTSLLVNTSDSSASPEAMVDERIKEINEKREAGKLERASKFKEFFWWCAGADRALLRKCPSDHSKYVGIGSVILFTALMAWFSSFIAMKLVFGIQTLELHFIKISFDFPIWAVLFATFWGSMIFFLDRFITNTMYSDGEVTISKDEFVGGLPRILIAIFLGIVISAPLELEIFKDEIETLLKNDLRIEYQNNKVDKSDILAFAKADVEKWEQEVKDAEKNVEFYTNPDHSGEAYNRYYGKIRRLIKDGDRTTSKGKPFLNPETGKYEANNITTNTGSSYETVRDDKKFYEDKFDADHKKAKRELDIAKDSLLWYRNQIVTIKNNLIKTFNVDSAYSNKGLYDRLDAMHRIALNEGKEDEFSPINRQNFALLLFIAISGVILTALIWWFSVDKWTRKKIVACIIFSLLVGAVVFYGCNTFYEIAYYLSTPIGLIMLLFILIDISPVLYKMMLADGVYDKYLQQEKQLKQSKIKLSLARMVRKIDKSELKALSPFIMGDFYNEMKDLKIDCSDKDSGDIKWGSNASLLDKILEEENKKLFETVLEYKKRIILASYSAWYRDMRDALIGMPDDSEGEKISPEEVLLNDTNFDNSSPTAEESNTNVSDDQNDVRNDDINSNTSIDGDNNKSQNADDQGSSTEIGNEKKSKDDDIPNNDDEYERVV